MSLSVVIATIKHLVLIGISMSDSSCFISTAQMEQCKHWAESTCWNLERYLQKQPWSVRNCVKW